MHVSPTKVPCGLFSTCIIWLGIWLHRSTGGVNTLEPIPQGHAGILCAVPWKCQGQCHGHEARGQCMMESLVPVDVLTASRFGSVLSEISDTS